MRTAIIGFILAGGTGAAIYLGSKLRTTRAVEQETQDRAQLASQNIKGDLGAKRQRDDLVRGWLSEHEILSSAKHLPENVGGKIISCPKCN